MIFQSIDISKVSISTLIKHWIGGLSLTNRTPAAGFGLSKPGGREPTCFACCFQLPPPPLPLLLFLAKGPPARDISAHNRNLHTAHTESPFTERSPNETQKRQTASIFDAFASATGAKRHDVPIGPKARYKTARLPLAYRASGSQKCQPSRRPP